MWILKKSHFHEEKEGSLDLTSYRLASVAFAARWIVVPVYLAAARERQAGLKLARLREAHGLPIEAFASIQTLSEAKLAEIDAVLDYNIVPHRLLVALGHPR